MQEECWNYKEYEQYYFDDNKKISDDSRSNLGLSGVRLFRTKESIEKAGTSALKDGVLTWRQFAWKSGRLLSANESMKNSIWSDDQFCWDGNNLRGKPIGHASLKSFIKRINNESETILNESVRKMYESVLELMGIDKDGRKLEKYEMVNNIGSVYILMVIHFLSQGSYPLYDRYAHKAVKALYNDKSPHEVFVGAAPGKNSVDDIMAMYDEYCFYLREIFGRIDIERDIDRALWVYGHCKNKAK